MKTTLHEILEDAAELVRRAAHPKSGKIALAPETVERLDNWNSSCGSVASSKSAGESAIDSGALAALAAEVAECRKCGLCETRTQTVFADGNPSADLVFVGEAPGEQEDRQGLPFVGRAGQLLTDIIVKGMKMRREDVYICNVIKCRPPENRDPSPLEKQACEPYLVRQLELVRPKVICALGGHAAKTLLKTDESTSKLRGKWHFYHGIPLRVTYHPAYLLRSPGEKRKTWEDIQEIMKVLNGEVEPQPGPGANAALL
jgi:uracil-DNA glycosylase